MHIVVTLKQVLDPRGILVNRRAGKVFFNREDHLMNPADKNALEAALRLKDADESVTISVLTAGTASCEAILREAQAMGADRAVRLPDPCLASDGAVVAHVLYTAINKLGGCDLLMLGERALDVGMGEMGPRLAQALGLPLILHAHTVSVNEEGVEAVVATPRGFMRVGASLPAVITVAHDANLPRRAYVPRLMRAYRASTLEAWTMSDLGLDPQSCEPRIGWGEPEAPPDAGVGRQVTSIEEIVAAVRPFVNGGAA